jgi:hypothetical protein
MRCTLVIKRVDDAIRRHESGHKEDLSIPMLLTVRDEILKMLSILSPAIYKPTYPRFILDWPDETGLIRILVDLAYDYERAGRGGSPAPGG